MNPFLSMFTKPSYENLSPEDFKKKLAEDKNSILVDVRTKGEHNDFRIPSSKLIDISSMHFKSEIEKLDKNKSLFVYCASGSRSAMACSTLKKMGFERVFNLSGGICSWTGKIER